MTRQALASGGYRRRLVLFHANPSKASELGRIGGSRRHIPPAENVDPLPTLDNVLAVRDTVAQLIADVYAGKSHPRFAASLVPLLNLQMRTIDAAELERPACQNR